MFLPIAYYQRQFKDLANIHIPVTDLGIHRGYSVFDFFKLKNLSNPWIDWYMERLFHSATSVQLNIQYTKNQLKELACEILRRNHVLDGYVKIIISAGESENGFNPSSEAEILIMALPFSTSDLSLYMNGAHLISVEYQRDIPTIKTTNYLRSAMIAQQLKNERAVDVLYHKSNIISESSRCNFYIVHDNIIKTASSGILKGVTRKRILSLEKLPNIIEETDVKLTDLVHASEAFISSTTKGIMPIVSVDEVKIGNGKVGPVAKELMTRINSIF